MDPRTWCSKCICGILIKITIQVNSSNAATGIQIYCTPNKQKITFNGTGSIRIDRKRHSACAGIAYCKVAFKNGVGKCQINIGCRLATCIVYEISINLPTHIGNACGSSRPGDVNR